MHTTTPLPSLSRAVGWIFVAVVTAEEHVLMCQWHEAPCEGAVAGEDMASPLPLEPAHPPD